MKSAYICCPMSGDIEGNIKKAIAYAKYVFYRCEMIPIVPHFYSYILEKGATEKEIIDISCEINNLLNVHDIWVFGDEKTEGMQYELSKYSSLNRKIHHMTDEQCDEVLARYLN